jgi:hypothetical protein
VVLTVLAVIAAGVGAAFFLGGDGDGDGSGGGPGGEAQLTPHPTLEPIGFPDARALDYDAGPDAACAAVSETMLARNYELQKAQPENGGADCWFGTPAAATLEDGTYNVTANIQVVMGEQAPDVYDMFTSASNVGSGGADMTWSPLYELPVGEEGWIVHSQNAAAGLERGDGVATFRQEDTTYHVVVYGWIEHPEGTSEPLPEEMTTREISDIVTGLGGGSAGEPQLSTSAAQEYPGLESFGEPLPPTEGSGEERCAPVTAGAAEQLDVQQTTAVHDQGTELTIPTTSCVYGPTEAAYGADDTGIRNIRITMEDYSASEVMYPAGELGSHLRHTMETLGESEGAGPLYALPAGSSGYLVYNDGGNGSGFLDAGWVVGDYYISVTISGFFNAGDFNTRALTEEELIADLSMLLTAMNG